MGQKEAKQSNTPESDEQTSTVASGSYSCNGKTVSIGQTMDEVKENLGKPLRKEKNDLTGHTEYALNKKQKLVMTKWTYKCKFKTYEFLFQNNILVSISLTLDLPDIK